jgi:hypothetical protein
LVVEFVFVLVGVTVGLTTDVGDVVLVVGVVVVLVVTAGLVVVVVFVAGVVVLDVSVGLVVKGTFGASVVFGVRLGFVVKDAGGLVGRVGVDKAGLVAVLVSVDVTGGRVEPPPVVIVGRAPPPVGVVPEVMEPEVRPVNEGRS